MPYAIITGATQGMGKAIAEKLLAEGFSVAICARNNTKLQEVKSDWEIRFPAATIFTYCADMSKKDEVIAFGEAVLATFQGIDILVNNAGTFVPGTISEEPDGNLEKMIALNLYGAYHLSRRIIPVMKSVQKGHIFNICSIAGLKPHPDSGAYSISKYAIVGFSDNLGIEMRRYNIKVTAICPGSTNTSSWDGEQVESGKLMEASDIADMLWSSYNLSPSAVVDRIVIQPVKG